MKSQSMTKGNRIKEVLTSENSDAIIPDGMDDALIGVYRGNGYGQTGLYAADTKAVYSYVKYIDILINRHSMSEEEAVEYFDSNISNLVSRMHYPIIIDDTGV